MSDKPEDRRETARRRNLRAAITRFEGPLSPIPCIMLDISEGGARLHAHEPGEIPDRFQLNIESEGLTFNCEVVWRQGNELGVKFVGS